MKVRTAALVHGHASERGATVTALGARERLARIDPRLWALMFRCLDPAPVDELRAEGHESEAIDAALELGLLVDASDPGDESARQWEDHRWSRAAQLVFSQLDLTYLEQDPGADRRRAIDRYLDETPYPDRPPFQGARHELPDRGTEPPLALLDALATRRSVRAFARVPVPLEMLSAILWRATEKVREAERQKSSGDPFQLLNSFYSWLDLHVVNQRVADLPPGAYRYDPLEHALWRTRAEVTDADVVASVAHQPWAGGSGAALYIGVQWDRFRWLYRHSRAYLSLMIQVGELAQELIGEAYRWQLGGWVTPAVDESGARTLLSLPEGIDAVMFVKLGQRAK